MGDNVNPRPFAIGEPVYMITDQGKRLEGEVLFHLKSLGEVYKIQFDDGLCVRINGWRLHAVDTVTRLGRIRT